MLACEFLSIHFSLLLTQVHLGNTFQHFEFLYYKMSTNVQCPSLPSYTCNNYNNLDWPLCCHDIRTPQQQCRTCVHPFSHGMHQTCLISITMTTVLFTISKTTFIPLYLRHFGTHDNLVARWWSTIFNEWPFNPHHFLGSEQYKHTTTWLLLLFNSRHINSNGHTTDISVHVALTTWLLGNKQHSSTIKTYVAGLAFGWYLDKKYHW